MHAGAHELLPRAVRKMNKQSLAVGSGPSLRGCAQCPASANVVVVLEAVGVVVVDDNCADA
jgi:hypothetical protein